MASRAGNVLTSVVGQDKSSILAKNTYIGAAYFDRMIQNLSAYPAQTTQYLEGYGVYTGGGGGNGPVIIPAYVHII